MSDETKFQSAITQLNRARDEAGVMVNGKLYSMVKDRVEVFRTVWGSEFAIATDIDYSNGFTQGSVIVGHAVVTDRQGTVMASGHAMDRVGSSEVSTTAVIEAVETSAIGRALACFGLHGGEYASDAEMTAIPRKREDAAPQNQNRVNHTVHQSGPPPRTELTGLFIPTPDNMRANLPMVKQRVIRDIDQVKSISELGKYWGELADFVDALNSNGDTFPSELKAAFATKNNQISNSER